MKLPWVSRKSYETVLRSTTAALVGLNELLKETAELNGRYQYLQVEADERVKRIADRCAAARYQAVTHGSDPVVACDDIEGLLR